MKKIFVLAVFVFLYIGPLFLAPSYALSATTPTEPNKVKDFTPASWYDTFQYRKKFTHYGQVGAGLDYQLPINVTYDSDMQSDFSDIRFAGPVNQAGGTDSNYIDHWLESYVASSWALFWIEANLTSMGAPDASDFWIYYGSSTASSASDGDATFLFFDDFENDNLNRWDAAGAYWDTVQDRVAMGSYSAFADSGAIIADRTLREDFGAYGGSDFLVHMWVQSQLQTSKEYYVRFSSTDQGASYPLVGDTDDFKYDNGPYADWELNTYLDDTWYEVDLAVDYTNSLFRFWLDGVSKGTQDLEDIVGVPYTAAYNLSIIVDTDANEDIWLDDVYIRKFVATAPLFGSWSDEEANPYAKDWYFINDAEVFFRVPFDMWGFNSGLVILGLIMIPLSSLYLAYGLKHDRSSNRLYYGIILFMVGCGLFVGGILPP